MERNIILFAYLMTAIILLLLLIMVLRSSSYMQLKSNISKNIVTKPFENNKSFNFVQNFDSHKFIHPPVYIIVNDCITKIGSDQMFL